MTEAKSEAPKPRKPRAPRTPKVEVSKEEELYYVRNRGYVRVRFSPPRKKGEEFTYSLAPRGERGDSEPVDPVDLAYFNQANENQGLYELITEKDAHSYMVKQTNNQQRRHPALEALRDEHGDPIRGISHESNPQTTVISQVVVPEGDLNQLNR